MKIFKFGGASVKNAESIKNVARILNQHSGEKIAIVLSAMGKNTNKLEELTSLVYEGKESSLDLLMNLKNFHTDILNDLFPGVSEIPESIAVHFNKLEKIIESGKQAANHRNISRDELYDIIVPFGELFSTSILHYYLVKSGINTTWINAAELIITDDTHREGNVKWEETRKRIKERTQKSFEDSNFILTQGFIGASVNGKYITLGREGSDYTASILANVLDADECVIWKDVPGVLNADPISLLETELIEKLSYKEAIELTYYGAKIIHPKTIKPLENKSIPLKVKSFKDPDLPGTLISSFKYLDFIPMYIFKQDQILISISARDMSFITENSLHRIFGLISYYGIKINLMQNSAISFSICIDGSEKLEAFIKDLQKDFFIKYNEQLEIVTIRHYDEQAIEKVLKDKIVIMEQRSRSTIQMVIERDD